MANIKKATSLRKDKLENALRKRGYSKNALAKNLFPKLGDGSAFRKLRRYLHDEMIAPEILEKIAMILDVWPDYLQGTTVFGKETFQDESDDDLRFFADDDFDDEGIYMGRYNFYENAKKHRNTLASLREYLNMLDIYIPVRNTENTMQAYQKRLNFMLMDDFLISIIQEEIIKIVGKELSHPRNHFCDYFVNRFFEKNGIDTNCIADGIRIENAE